MGKNASNTPHLLRRRLFGLVLAFLALLATTIVLPTLTAHTSSAYAATRSKFVASLTVLPPSPTATTPIVPPTPTPTTPPPPTYVLAVTPVPLSQDILSCIAVTANNYTCSVTLSITPTLPAGAVVTWNAGLLGGGTLLGNAFPALVTISNLACPSATLPISFSAAILLNGLTLQATPASDQWNCTVPPTATPSPTPTTAPTATPTTGPSPTAGPTQTPPPGSTPPPGTTPTPTTINGTPVPVPSTTTPNGPNSHTNTPTKTPQKTSGPGTSSTQNTQGNGATPTSTPTQGGIIKTNSSGKNDPPTFGGGGSLYLVASLVLAALAFLLYLFSWSQGGIAERLLSLVLPVSVVRKLRGQ